MSHEIVNEMIAYSGETPWHGIGARLEAGSSPEEFLKAAKLDWTIDKHPLQTVVGDKTIAVPDKFALLRSSDHKLMGVASGAWTPFQNADALEFMRRYCEAGGATMETAGGLRDGRIVWGLARLNHSFEVRPGDKVNGYLLITTPHVVGMSTSVRTTTVRVVCANTMAMANNSSTIEYRQNHMSAFDATKAKEAVEQAHENLLLAELRAKTLDKLKLNLEDAVKKVLVPAFDPDLAADDEFMAANLDVEALPKRFQNIIDSLQTAPGAIEGNGWGALNAVTHYCDHIAGHNPGTRLFRSWIGDYSRVKLDVEKRLLELAA
jgi:phage/plasmid-like protein (TIGR03299 family)